MVTSMILSRYVGTPPRDGEDRKIQGGPLYLDIIDLIDECDTLPWTRRCIRDVQSLSLDADYIKSMLIKAVTKGRFLGSEWCQGSKPGVWAACDAYSFEHSFWCQAMHKELNNEFYIKFFVNITGNVVLTVSLHLSN